MKTNARVTTLIMVMCLAAVLVLTGGCKGKKQQAINPELTTPTTDSGGGLPDVDQGALQWKPATDLEKIYFDYDSYALRPDALKSLGVNAEKMKADPANTMFQVEGHCDERGTQEYNMALGEKRALAVREHLIKLGIAGDRIVTISYGKERPVAGGHNEAAWKQNRRAEFNRATK